MYLLLVLPFCQETFNFHKRLIFWLCLESVHQLLVVFKYFLILLLQVSRKGETSSLQTHLTLYCVYNESNP